MPQLNLYVPEEVAVKIRKKAGARNISISRYLADVIKREVGQGWPEGYFEKVCGKWEGDFPAITRENPEDLDGVS
ncbi:MAG: hypothetical protein WAL98_20080 [Desulfatiglandaceae bacterium]